MDDRIKLVIETLEDLEINSPEVRFEMARIIAIEELTKILNGGWISISKKLPPIQENVLICFSYGNIITGYYFDNEWYDCNYDDKLNQENIVAWQSLPEKFKEII